MIKELQDHVAVRISPIAKLKDIRFGEKPAENALKIMRRLLRSLAKGDTEVQDVSDAWKPGNS